MVCPDGSSVGRVGPNCEFTPCPPTTSKPNDETANWKTYTDSQNGFSFKYPPSFYQVPIGQNTMQFTPVSWPAGEIGKNELDRVGYGIGVLVSTENQTLQGIADNFDRFKTRSDYSRTVTVIDNVSGYKLTDVAMDFPTDAVTLLRDNKEYFIYVKYYSLLKKSEGKNNFDKILSTFKFTSVPLSGAGQTQGGDYKIGGTFTEKATEAEIGSLSTKLGSDAASISLLESFPLQFQITSPSKTSCEKVKTALTSLKFVSSVGDCQKAESGTSDSSDQSIISN